MIRVGKVDKKFIDDLIDQIPPEDLEKIKFSENKNVQKEMKKTYKITLQGHKISYGSQRLVLFRNFDSCCNCGLKGTYYGIDKHGAQGAHLNLYGVNQQGEEVLITKDHIVAKSSGGKNTIDNYQTMCIICNNLKGAKNSVLDGIIAGNKCTYNFPKAR